jgi:hypothetical protein
VSSRQLQSQEEIDNNALQPPTEELIMLANLVFDVYEEKEARIET